MRTLKTFLFVLFFLFGFVFISANYCYWLAFDSNFFFILSDTSQFSDSISIPAEKLTNTSVLFVFDLENNAEIFWGPSSWNHKDGLLYFKKESEDDKTSFAEFYGRPESNSLSKEQMRDIAYGCSLDDLYAIIEFTDSVKNVDYPLLPERFSNAEGYKMFADYFDFLRKRKIEENFESAEKLAYGLYCVNKNDITLMKIYLYILMDNGKFNDADKLINDFYKKIARDVTYYSLKANLFAIKGMFKKAEEMILEGRQHFPQSMLLLNDAINIYSVVDTSKMIELLKIRNIYLK